MTIDHYEAKATVVTVALSSLLIGITSCLSDSSNPPYNHFSKVPRLTIQVPKCECAESHFP